MKLEELTDLGVPIKKFKKVRVVPTDLNPQMCYLGIVFCINKQEECLWQNSMNLKLN
jgi:hypothetical protein